MGHSQADKTQNHDRIVAIAAKRFREAGVDGVSIADLMKEAGLTHGGFYKHFASREDLVAQGVGAALKSGAPPANRAQAPAGPPTYASVIEAYLSTGHRDTPGTGCGVGALVNDMRRTNDTARALYQEQLERNFTGLASLAGAAGRDASRASAILAYSAMVGAIGLSRAIDDEALSEEILTTVTALLLRDAS